MCCLRKRRISLPWIRIWSCFHPMFVQSIAAMQKPPQFHRIHEHATQRRKNGDWQEVQMRISTKTCLWQIAEATLSSSKKSDSMWARLHAHGMCLLNKPKQTQTVVPSVFLTPAVLSTVCFQIPGCCRVHEMTDNLGSNVEYTSTFEEASLGST